MKPVEHRESTPPNRLITEKSPYLLKHAFNPVQWYSWGKEAFDKAKNDNKPVFLSIGYFSCHWCTVMERESFEDKKIADLINRNFIPIKVDREERPEVDSYYMSAVQALTGQGGWPLTVFLTPDLKPFYGGTYFPPEPRYGMPSFRQVLEFVAKLWKDNRVGAGDQANRLLSELGEAQTSQSGGPISSVLLDDAFASLAASFDAEHGGLGSAPKFPLPLSLEFMLRYHFRARKELALRVVVKSLQAMASGGIHDHLGGGFHRYSTDRVWLVPHFEKMLYDNALLAATYLHAYQATDDEGFAEVAKDTLAWMIAELEAVDGGFFSAQDADTEQGEGIYYTWTPDEIGAVLGEREAERFRYAYGVTKNGNFEGGRSILHLAESIEDTASKFGLTSAQTVGDLAKSRAALYGARLERPRPATDTKILTSWNGLAISALAQASEVFGDAGYRRAAEKAAAFVLTRSVKDGALQRRYAGGEAGIPATLEDYAFLGIGLLDLFGATSDPRWLKESIALAEKMLNLFEDAGGGFFMSATEVPARMVESHDGPTPSGNSAAVMLLQRLSAITDNARFRQSADKALRRFAPEFEKAPTSHPFMLLSVDSLVNGTREVVVSTRSRGEADSFLRGLRKSFLPDTTSFVLDDENRDSLSALTPLAEGRTPRSEPAAYVCQNFACKLPARSPAELEMQLGIARG